MSNNSRDPLLRFDGYDENWHSVGFESITYPAGERNKNNLPLESYSITNEDGFVPQGQKFEKGGTMKNADKSMYIVVTPCSFAYNPARINVGSIGYQDLGKDVIVSSLYEVFKTTNDVDDRFLWHWFHTDTFKKQILKYQEGGVRLYFYYDKLCMGSIVLPKEDEQADIGAFFDNLERLITSNKKELEKAKQTKNYFMNTLFAEKHEENPETRFSRFARSWAVLPLSKIMTPYTDYLPTPTDGYTRLGIRSHMKGTFYEYVPPTKKLGEKRLQRVKRDNFIVNIVFAWEHAVAVTTQNDEGKLVSHRFPQFSFNDGMYPQFFQYALNSEKFRHHLWLASPSGAGRNKTLRIDEMMEYELRVPEYDEQKEIASFLTDLDTLIQLYDSRVTKLQNIKTACLQGMYV